MENRVIKVGMLGLGTVGTGVYKVLKSQESEMEAKLGAKVELKKILVRNLENSIAESGGSLHSDQSCRRDTLR